MTIPHVFNCEKCGLPTVGLCEFREGSSRTGKFRVQCRECGTENTRLVAVREAVRLDEPSEWRRPVSSENSEGI